MLVGRRGNLGCSMVQVPVMMFRTIVITYYMLVVGLGNCNSI